MRRLLRLIAPIAGGAAVVLSAVPGPASAHPLGNLTVNRALAIGIDVGVELTAVLDMAEIPAYETIRDLDGDGDDAVSKAEGALWATSTCGAWRARIEVVVDGRRHPLQPGASPVLDFPAGAGGLPTLRLECRSTIDVEGGAREHALSISDTTVDARIGWREISAVAAEGAEITQASIPTSSPTGLLTSYPDSGVSAPLDVRQGSVTFRTDPTRDSQATLSIPGATRDAPANPLASLISGEISPIVVALAVLLSIGLGAAHALSPGHGKTLVAAYVLGAGGTARAAVRIGLWVAISHTAGVFVLGVVTLAASQFLLPERLIGWLSLGSGVIVTGLGLALLARVVRARRSAPPPTRPTHGHGHGHDHRHEPGDDHEHGHSHDVPAAAELSWRSAIALGFAGGAVPSASALIVLLVAVSTDRIVLGALLIGCFGIGMAGVLGGLAYAIARVRRLATSPSTWSRRPLVRRLAALAPTSAGLVVLATGVAFTAAAVSQLA